MVWCENKKQNDIKNLAKIYKSKFGEKFKFFLMKNGYNKWRGGKKKLQKLPYGERFGLPSQKGLL